MVKETSVKRLIQRVPRVVYVSLIFAVCGTLLISLSGASTPVTSLETESGILSGNAQVVSDASASGGSAISFGHGPGAQLPISYDINAITDAKLYVSPTGTDAPGNGSSGAPFKTVKYAISQMSTSPTTILVAGGTYDLDAEGNKYVYWDRAGYTVTIKALPGEIPVFDGSKAAPLSATTENGVGPGGADLKHFAYDTVVGGLGAGLGFTNLPAATFSGTTPTGIAATHGWKCVSGSVYSEPSLTPTTSNPSGCASGSPYVISAYYPDQAWYDGARLRQVLQKDKVTTDSFYVERTSATDGAITATQLYIDNSLDLSKVRVSSNKYDIRLSQPNITLEGLRFIRNSPGGIDTGGYSTIYLTSGADNAVLRNLEFEDNANISLQMSGSSSSSALQNVTIDQVTIKNSGWMGMGGLYTDYLEIRDSLVDGSNTDREYNFAPQTGGIKFSRVYKTKVLNSMFSNNYSSGVWFDQSNYDSEVVGNRFAGNANSSFFYEISHGLVFANNYVDATGTDRAFRAAGSSGLKIVNNTFVGGGGGIVVYTDDRSEQYDSDGNGTPDRWCSENAYRYGGGFVANCGGMSSDLNKLHLGAYGATNDTPGMNWLPQVDIIMNNIITDQDVAGGHSNCSYDAVAVCVTSYHDSGSVRVDPLNIFDTQAVVNGNIYQTNDPTKRFWHLRLGSGQTCGVDAVTLADLQSAFANASCYNKSVEPNGKYSSTHEFATNEGAPQAGLSHADAAPIPTDTSLNAYIPAGTRHYGVIY